MFPTKIKAPPPSKLFTIYSLFMGRNSFLKKELLVVSSVLRSHFRDGVLYHRQSHRMCTGAGWERPCPCC